MNETKVESNFFKPHESGINDLTFYHKKMKCLDMNNIEVQGDYNSPTARSFVLTFVKCNNQTYEGPGFCRPESEIKKWIQRKFILVNQNNKRFSTREYSYDKKVTQEARLEWIPLNSQVREEIVYKI